MTEQYNYYQEELDIVNPGEYSIISIKILKEDIDENTTSSTKWMSLNRTNIDTFINFLQEFKNRMS